MSEYISREAVINITAETGAWETQNRVRELPAADVQPVKHGQWIMKKKTELFLTGLMAVTEGHVLTKTSADKPFTEREANIVRLKEHRTIKIPYCSICQNYGDDEYDKTPYCPYCGARMDGDSDADLWLDDDSVPNDDMRPDNEVM